MNEVTYNRGSEKMAQKSSDPGTGHDTNISGVFHEVILLVFYYKYIENLFF